MYRFIYAVIRLLFLIYYKMTVKELIEQLQKMPQDKEVMIKIRWDYKTASRIEKYWWAGLNWVIRYTIMIS